MAEIVYKDESHRIGGAGEPGGAKLSPGVVPDVPALRTITCCGPGDVTFTRGRTGRGS